ncbi:hypothetical protein H6P81_004793 [Aristolochia fimbriata]|uniref:Glycosyltransferase N-terminal domain-containing protein n=1 Tax=Aristolochia fimbriata TaxID=158543 RepID=A0AAV7ETB5_ARIFI|nr:hypothetical protein H6P81_004793 [Aristolochia fimbriata]
MGSHMEKRPEISTSERVVVVLMVPLPAQGHLNQLIHLSRLLLSAGDHVQVHFACSATHNRQAKLRVHGWDVPNSSSKLVLHFHDLPFPTDIPTPPPDPSSPLKFPAHLQPTFDAAVTHLRLPLAALLRSLSATARRVAVVHDSLMSFVAEDAAGVPNAEAYAFHSASAFATFGFFLEYSMAPVDKKLLVDINVPQKLKQIYLSSPSPPLKTCFTDAFLELIRTQVSYLRYDVGEIYNTCEAIEGDFLDCLSREPFGSGASLTWAIGPLNSIAAAVDDKDRHECMEWLDRQPPGSVLYVSFGTMTSMSVEQVKELAKGLRDSQQRFLWVLRDADTGDIFSKNKLQESTPLLLLPEGFEEEEEEAEEGMGSMGMVLRGEWAPQVAILGHRATGGFMTHCGWNSSMESMSAGVAVVAWPMASDQPWNATLLTDVLGMGVSLRDWAKWDQVVPAADIEAAVRRLMESEEGKDIRKRAAEVGVAVRAASVAQEYKHAWYSNNENSN